MSKNPFLIQLLEGMTDIDAAGYLECLVAADESAKELDRRVKPPLLMVGETGTGKSMLARLLHQKARLRGALKGSFIYLNMASVRQGLALDELVGHKKGAFSGADEPRKGRFKLAEKGTLLLDEIHRAPEEVQGDLLSIIEERLYWPIGSEEKSGEKVDCWVIAATTAPEEIIPELRWRLSTILRLRPLRERKGAIPGMAHFFAKAYAIDMGMEGSVSFDTSAIEWLQEQPFWGNIRELAEVLRQVVRFRGYSVKEITREALEAVHRGVDQAANLRGPEARALHAARALLRAREESPLSALADLVRASKAANLPTEEEILGTIAEAYSQAHGRDPKKAASTLNVDPATLRTRLQGKQKPAKRDLKDLGSVFRDLEESEFAKAASTVERFGSQLETEIVDDQTGSPVWADKLQSCLLAILRQAAEGEEWTNPRICAKRTEIGPIQGWEISIEFRGRPIKENHASSYLLRTKGFLFEARTSAAMLGGDLRLQKSADDGTTFVLVVPDRPVPDSSSKDG